MHDVCMCDVYACNVYKYMKVVTTNFFYLTTNFFYWVTSCLNSIRYTPFVLYWLDSKSVCLSYANNFEDRWTRSFNMSHDCVIHTSTLTSAGNIIPR